MRQFPHWLTPDFFLRHLIASALTIPSVRLLAASRIHVVATALRLPALFREIRPLTALSRSRAAIRVIGDRAVLALPARDPQPSGAIVTVTKLTRALTDEMGTVTKRGRPPKGEQPMSDSERKRDQRTRDRRAAIEAIGNEHDASLRALLAILGRVEESEAARHSAQRAWVEIGRRYKFVTVTK